MGGRSKVMKTSWDSVAALMRELSNEEQQALVDSDNRPAIKKFLMGLAPLLTPIGTIAVRLAPNFVASEFFKVNSEKSSPIKIVYIGESFGGRFFSPMASRPIHGYGPFRPTDRSVVEVTLRYQTLNKCSVDKPIINQLGGEAKAETTLTEIAACMQKHADGEQGVLLTNGYANIFYVRDVVSGLLCAVRVSWYGDGWLADAHSVLDKQAWPPMGYRVFSRVS